MVDAVGFLNRAVKPIEEVCESSSMRRLSKNFHVDLLQIHIDSGSYAPVCTALASAAALGTTVRVLLWQSWAASMKSCASCRSCTARSASAILPALTNSLALKRYSANFPPAYLSQKSWVS